MPMSVSPCTESVVFSCEMHVLILLTNVFVFVDEILLFTHTNVNF